MQSLVGILFFGSLWGLIEATFGGALHFAGFPYAGTIMASVGFSILYAAARAGVSPVRIAGISVLAASFKLLDCWLFGLPALHITVVNPATAIACQGIAAAVIFRNIAHQNSALELAPRFLGAALASVVIFNGISFFGYGWPTDQTIRPINTLLIQVPFMCIISTAISKTYSVFEKRVHLSTITPAWQAAAAMVFIAIAIITRASLS